MKRRTVRWVVVVGATVLLASVTAGLAVDPGDAPRGEAKASAGYGDGAIRTDRCVIDRNRTVTGVVLAYDDREQRAIPVQYRIAPMEQPGLFLDVGNVSHRASVQSSLRTARRVAQRIDSHPFKGLSVSLQTPERWQSVSGESAGLPLTLALLDTTSNYTIRESIVATGALVEDGTVAHVGHVRAKAVAARDAGFETILVPRGQTVAVQGIDVVPVSNVSQALSRATVERASSDNWSG